MTDDTKRILEQQWNSPVVLNPGTFARLELKPLDPEKPDKVLRCVITDECTAKRREACLCIQMTKHTYLRAFHQKYGTEEWRKLVKPKL